MLFDLSKNFLPRDEVVTDFPDMERNADKVIFGSDWPGGGGDRGERGGQRSLGLRKDVVDKILWKTAEYVLGMN